jgi:hypothetical protein
MSRNAKALSAKHCLLFGAEIAAPERARAQHDLAVQQGGRASAGPSLAPQGTTIGNIPDRLRRTSTQFGVFSLRK